MEDPSTMDRLRADMIRRARLERHGEFDVESGNRHPDMQEARSNQPPFPRLFRRSQPAPTTTGEAEIESIKSQESNPNRPGLANRRLGLPGFLRIWGGSNNGSSPTHDVRNTTASPAPLLPLAHQPPSPSSPTPQPTRPDPVATPSESRRSRRCERNANVDPVEAQLAEILGGSNVGRRRRQRTRHERERDRRRAGRNGGRRHPKHFLCCLPWIRSRRMRAQILRCFASGLFLIFLVTLYLALTITNKVNTKEMTIMLILVILFATVFFFHGLARLCILVIKSNREAAIRANRPPRYRGPARYAVPPVPIPVVLARDEEAAGMESEATKLQPPAYGRWRETVRVDPDRLFWQRNDAVDLSQLRPNPQSGPRPPSYVSEDGVSYVIEAAPRSTAPTTFVPLPPHPSEIGRVARLPTE